MLHLPTNQHTWNRFETFYTTTHGKYEICSAVTAGKEVSEANNNPERYVAEVENNQDIVQHLTTATNASRAAVTNLTEENV